MSLFGLQTGDCEGNDLETDPSDILSALRPHLSMSEFPEGTNSHLTPPMT